MRIDKDYSNHYEQLNGDAEHMPSSYGLRSMSSLDTEPVDSLFLTVTYRQSVLQNVLPVLFELILKLGLVSFSVKKGFMNRSYKAFWVG